MYVSENRERLSKLRKSLAAMRQEERDLTERVAAEERSAKDHGLLDPDLLWTAAVRLCREATHRNDGHPSPYSPDWIGRPAEAEGWPRRILVAGLAFGQEIGYLAVKVHPDLWGRERAVVNATPVALQGLLFPADDDDPFD